MKSEDTHGIIRQVFKFRDDDNLPFVGRRGFGRELFPSLVSKLGYTIGAEIGVKHGKFSVALCKENPQLKLFCIDPWGAYSEYESGIPNRRTTDERFQGIYEAAVTNLASCNAKLIRKTSMDALADFQNESLDFVCIDGNHNFDFVCPDIIFWSMKVRSGGLVICHDYHGGGWYGVVPAVDAYTRCHHIDPWYATKEDPPTAFWVKP